MATTTKSTKSSAKPKTTKKPTKTVAAKTAVKTSSKTVKATQKTVKKVVPATKKVSKAPANVAPKVARVARTLTTATLRKWHLASAVIFAALAATVGFVAQASTYEVTISHAAKDDLASKTQTVFASAAHVIRDCDVRVAVIVLLVVSALFAVVRATRLRAQEDKGLTARVLPLRWLDFAVTFGAITAIVALLAGVHDGAFLKLLALTTATSFFFAWLAEREAAHANAQTKLFFRAGLVAAVLPWLIIAISVVSTTVYGDIRYTAFVYVAAAIGLAGGALVANNLRNALHGANYLKSERNYIALNLLTKAAFAAALIFGLKG